MLLKEIMSTSVITVGPEDSIESVAQIMAKKRIHGLPVVENNILIGIITETDFFVKDSLLFLPSYIGFLKKTNLNRSLEKKKSKKVNLLLNAKAKDIMSSPCSVVSPDNTLEDVIKIFKKTQYATLPVVNKKQNIVGIITISDIIQLSK